MPVQPKNVNAGPVMTEIFGLVLSVLLLLGNAPTPRFVPGEVLVKFVPGTEGSSAVIQASRVSPPDLGALAQVTDRLQAKVNTPLRAKQVTSGQWVLLSVDGDKLTDQLLEKLRGRKNVAGVQPTAGKTEAYESVSLPKKLVIRFSPGSPESQAVARKLADPNDMGFAHLLRDLEKGVGLPVQGEVDEAAMAVVQIDLGALTLKLCEQLKALADVETAQPNYILRIQ